MEQVLRIELGEDVGLVDELHELRSELVVILLYVVYRAVGANDEESSISLIELAVP